MPSSAQMTLDRYAGLCDGHLDEVTERMGSQFLIEESEFEVTGSSSVRPLRVAGMDDTVAAQRVSLVAPRGFEPPTQGLGNLCSIP